MSESSCPGRRGARLSRPLPLSLGVIAGVGNCELGSDFRSPRLNSGTELFDSRRIARRKILHLTWILLEIVEFAAIVLLELNQFPVNRSDRCIWSRSAGMVMRIVPE